MADQTRDLMAALEESIAKARADREFAARLRNSTERNRPILDRLSDVDGPEPR